MIMKTKTPNHAKWRYTSLILGGAIVVTALSVSPLYAKTEINNEKVEVKTNENKKVVVNLPEGTTQAEITVREGAASRVLDPKAPVKIDLSGVIGAPVEFLEKRLSEADQINPKRCHVLVDREKVCITLVTNENDEYTTGRVVGRLSQHPKFSEFGINTGKGWEPNELGQFFKMNRAFFPDKTANMKLVTELKNFEATVNSKVEKQKSEKGDFKDNYSGVVMSNLPEAFTLQIPISKGMPAETIEVEFYASVNGRDVTLQLVSPGACQLLEDLRDRIIDVQVARIRELSPEIAIIEQ